MSSHNVNAGKLANYWESPNELRPVDTHYTRNNQGSVAVTRPVLPTSPSLAVPKRTDRNGFRS